MSVINVPLAEEDLAFLRAYSEEHGTSAEAFLARQARNLREQLQRPIGPETVGASGIIVDETDGEARHREYLEAKHA